jgi:hypothetical protein
MEKNLLNSRFRLWLANGIALGRVKTQLGDKGFYSIRFHAFCDKANI